MIGFGQGFASISTLATELDQRVAIRGNHGGNPVLRWMASNVSIKQEPAGNMKPDKLKSTERIDGIVATLMALGGVMEFDDERGSAYDDGEIMFV